MTLRDFIDETVHRYRSQPVTTATRESLSALRYGLQRRVADPYVGTPIWERGDWDVLLVLDACRYDMLPAVGPEYDRLPSDPDAYGTTWSVASCSIDWIERTFNDHPDEIGDVAYITANPFADHDAASAQSADLADNDALGYLRRVYQHDWHEIGGIETVPPEWVTDHAIEAWRNRDAYGFDRMVVHYMQPHEPYITRPEWSYQTPRDHAVLKNLVDEDYEAGTSPWRSMVESGEVTIDEFWPVYLDNLRWVLDDVCGRLLENCDADEIVLTADHGNALDEWGTWHHPPGAIAPGVRKVPWLTVEGSDLWTVNPRVRAPETGLQTGADATIDERLSALGYAE